MPPIVWQPIFRRTVLAPPPHPSVLRGHHWRYSAIRSPMVKHYAEYRGLYRVFNAAGYELWRKLGSAPDWDSDSPFATASSLPDTPADTYADGTWYLALTYTNGVVRSGFYPVGTQGELYKVLIVSGGAAESTPPTGGLDDILTLKASGVVRITALYIPWLDGSSNRADEWAIAYTTNGSTPSEDSPDVTQAMSSAGTVEQLVYDLPAQSHGTTVKVRVQTRRNDGTVGSPVWVYSDGSAVRTATADAQGPAAPAAGDTWRGRLPEDL